MNVPCGAQGGNTMPPKNSPFLPEDCPTRRPRGRDRLESVGTLTRSANAGVARGALQNRGLQVRFPPGRESQRRGWNSSTGLPEGSSRMTCEPPGPATTSLVRNDTPAARSRVTSAARSVTSR